MAKVKGLQCLRCGALYAPDHYAEDCPACRPVVRSNLVVVYDEPLALRRPDAAGAGPSSGLWRYGDVLPVSEADAVSLGEGGSPLRQLRAVGDQLGLKQLYGKDESGNPTWSFKDRLACIAVSVAKQMGAKTIVSSSSGNAGAAAAAYAAKAGIPCVVFTFGGAAGPMVTQMRAYGAKVVAVPQKEDRWRFMEHAVRQYGWFPTSPFFGPAVGSNPYGIEGYKTLAYETVEQLGWRAPDWCILPVCYGDALIGMWRGFTEMKAAGWIDRMPKMVAAEVYGSIGRALDDDLEAPPAMPKTFDTVSGSIGAVQGTYQALEIVRKSGGRAVTISNDETMRWQHLLATREARYLEPASAGGLVAVERLAKSGIIKPDDVVVSLLTASGLKDPAVTAATQGDTIAVPSDLSAAWQILQSAGIFPSN
ncbi:pyridoxal-phosphate dependent enzyme [Rhodopseudomonas sp. NSM]|uniref:pyridoxal-phosphate dependent enzyme n=1 Tax=Rhodopseudomonas sp. NSM TaxID=3457630 RepID=UPI004037374E